MQSVLFHQTGAGEYEVPGAMHSSTSYASLLLDQQDVITMDRSHPRERSHARERSHPRERSHARVTGMEDKRKQVQVTLLGHIIQSTPRRDMHHDNAGKLASQIETGSGA